MHASFICMPFFHRKMYVASHCLPVLLHHDELITEAAVSKSQSFCVYSRYLAYIIKRSDLRSLCFSPRTGELRTQKLKSHLVRTQSLHVLPFKPGVGQCIAIHATLTAREFFLAYFFPSSPFTCIFPKPLPIFSCVGLQNKIGHPAGCRFPCRVPTEYKYAKNKANKQT